MKWVSVLLLAVLAATVLAPLSAFSFAFAGSGQQALGNLDVCNSAAPALSVHGDMPCVTASIGIASPLLFRTIHEPLQKTFVELILSTRNEQPPRS